jgi:hypothetical protein
MLVAEEDHLVLQQGVVDRRDRLGIEIPGQTYAVDAGADVQPSFTTSMDSVTAPFRHVIGAR